MSATSVLLVFVSTAYAQLEQAGGTPQTMTADRNAQNAPSTASQVQSRWKWRGVVRSRLEVWDWFNPAAAGSPVSGRADNYAFLGAYMRLSLTRTFRRGEVLVEASVPLLLGLPENASWPAPYGQLGHGGSYRDANGGRVAFPSVRQAYARFTGLPDNKSSLKVGRFEFIEGHEGSGQDPTLDWMKRERVAQRLIGNFGFTHVQRAADAIELARNSGSWHLLAAAGRPTEGVFKLDANRGLSNVLFTYAGLTRATRTQDFRLFHTFYRDRRGVTKVDARPTPLRVADHEAISISSVGAHYARRIGRADLLFYGVLQTGRWGAQSHRADAWVVEAGYQPVVRGRPWFRAGLNQGSGDQHALDRRHGTFFQMLPTARIYARFPFFNMMNSKDAFIQAILRPRPRLTFRADYHRLRLSSETDLWYAGGGASDSRSFGFAGRTSSGYRNVGTLADVQADVRLDERNIFAIYYGHARGGDVIRNIYTARSNANLIFFEVSRLFGAARQ